MITPRDIFKLYVAGGNTVEFQQISNGEYLFCNTSEVKPCQTCSIFDECNTHDTESRPLITDKEYKEFRTEFPEYFV